MSAITMDGTSLETMDGINPWEASISMDYIHPNIGNNITATPKKWKLTL